MVDVSIIIVSFNTKDLTLACIKSIIDEGSELTKEIIIVDNGSTDGTVEELTKLTKLIKLIKNSENLGFSKANNQGIKVAKGKHILLLNSDTKVKREAIKKLVDFAEVTPNAGVVGPMLLNPNGSEQPSVFRYPTLARAFKQYWLGKKRLLEKYYPEKTSAVETIVMAAFLITPHALKKVGLLDERYFMFYEDLDYCKRVNKSGLKVYFLPSAKVLHYHGASGKKLTEKSDQWRRLIPSSKIYHGTVKHYLFNFILWSGQKWQKLLKSQN
jgi:hypothetical protein